MQWIHDGTTRLLSVKDMLFQLHAMDSYRQQHSAEACRGLPFNSMQWILYRVQYACSTVVDWGLSTPCNGFGRALPASPALTPAAFNSMQWIPPVIPPRTAPGRGLSTPCNGFTSGDRIPAIPKAEVQLSTPCNGFSSARATGLAALSRLAFNSMQWIRGAVGGAASVAVASTTFQLHAMDSPSGQGGGDAT